MASKQDVDLDTAKRLVADLSQRLAELGGDSPRLQELRDEVRTLQEILQAPEARHSRIADSLKAVEAALREAAAELYADGVKLGSYASEIGRILGLR
jgi:chromosome segregation ATPase